MAIRNFSFSRHARLSLLLLVLTACQSAPLRRGSAPVRSSAPPIVAAPEVGAPPASPALPTREEAKKVAVILGPGGAKAFAHVGVLKAFQQQRIPIEKVIGLEWGALVGALFASKGQVNDLEWKLYKMEQRGLPRPKGFFAKKLGEDSVKIMDDYLQDVFLNEDVTNSRVAFECPARLVSTGAVVWQNRGLSKNAMKRCLPFPPLFKVQGTFVAGASQASEAVERLRLEGYNVIILVNVLGSAMAQDSLPDNLDYVILWQEVRRALTEAAKFNVEVVNVDTSAFPIVQFEGKKDLIGLGEAAGQKAAASLISKYGF